MHLIIFQQRNAHMQSGIAHLTSAFKVIHVTNQNSVANCIE